MSASSSPFRFLEPLRGDREEDRRILRLTRGRELDQVRSMVAASRVSLLYAHSGNGKTSLLQAGVVPYFEEHSHAVFHTRPRPPWEEHDPVEAVKGAVLRGFRSTVRRIREERAFEELEQLVGTASGPSRSRMDALVARARRAPALASDVEVDGVDETLRRLEGAARGSLVDLLSAASLALEGRRILLVCDQFEELFVHYGRSAKLERFVEEIGKAWAHPSLELHVLFSMREEWVGSMIAFRQAIPDVFKHYARLSALPRERAVEALVRPLAAAGQGIERRALDAVLDDLVDCHRRRSGGHDDADDPVDPAALAFVDLPALQIVADALWTSREGYAGVEPFSFEHYERVGKDARALLERNSMAASASSPAQAVLDGYLLRVLAAADAGMPAPAAEPARGRELQLDCLHALTDGERHRRAARLERLERELALQRPVDLDLPAADGAAIREALAPLAQAHVVLVNDGSDGQPRYELAHDFAVPAVLRAWRAQERARVMELGRLSTRRKAHEAQRQVLLGTESRASVFLRWASIVALVAWGWVSVTAFAMLVDGESAAMELGAVAFAFVVIAVVAVIHRQRTGVALGALGALSALSLPYAYAWAAQQSWLLSPGERAWRSAQAEEAQTALFDALGASTSPEEKNRVVQLQAALRGADLETEAYLVAMDLERLAASTSNERSKSAFARAALAVQVFSYVAASSRGGVFALAVAWAVLGLFVLSRCLALLHALAGRAGAEAALRWRRIRAEFTDVALRAATFLAAAYGALHLGVGGAWLLVLLPLVFALSLRDSLGVRLQVGMLQTTSGLPVSAGRTVLREVALWLWTGLSLGGVLVPFVAGLLIRREGRGVPDLLAGTRPWFPSADSLVVAPRSQLA